MKVAIVAHECLQNILRYPYNTLEHRKNAFQAPYFVARISNLPSGNIQLGLEQRLVSFGTRNFFYIRLVIVITLTNT